MLQAVVSYRPFVRQTGFVSLTYTFFLKYIGVNLSMLAAAP